MRQLATIQKITAIDPIPDRDQIGLAHVLGWRVIVRYDQFAVGDLCVFFEIDSLLPEKPEFEFMRARKFRVKTLKMAGVISQGLCMPVSILPPADYSEGDNVTDVLGITKYEPPEDIPQTKGAIKGGKSRNKFRGFLYRFPLTRALMKRLSQDIRLDFPVFIAKTDESRCEGLPWIFGRRDIPYEVHEKVDGQSGTFLLERHKHLRGLYTTYDFSVYSRNYQRLKDNSSYWSVAERYHIKEVLLSLLKKCDDKSDWVCIQGECIAPGVQGNKYHVDTPDLYCFNLITQNSGRVDSIKAAKIVEEYGMKWVPLISEEYYLPATIEELKDFADGESALYPTLREGLVFRNYEKGISFKNVSKKFLLKYKE